MRLNSVTGMGGDLIIFLMETGVKRKILYLGDRNGWSKVLELKETKLWLPIQERAQVTMIAGAGAKMLTEVSVNKSKEQSLLGQRDAYALGIVVIRAEGDTEAVTVSRVLHNRKAIHDKLMKNYKGARDQGGRENGENLCKQHGGG